jgi:hypothetical protein
MMEEEPHSDIVEQTEILERAVWRKWNKFTWSGLLIGGVGCIVIVLGFFLNTGAYSAEGLLIGLGAIVVLVGIIRIFIGLINPSSPEELRSVGPRLSDEDKIMNTLSDE